MPIAIVLIYYSLGHTRKTLKLSKLNVRNISYRKVSMKIGVVKHKLVNFCWNLKSLLSGGVVSKNYAPKLQQVLFHLCPTFDPLNFFY